MQLTGKVALVSGAARGLGLAIAERFVEEGAKVALADIKMDLAEREAERLRKRGAEAMAIKLDVTEQGSWTAALAACEAQLGPADILVNNAGLGRLASLEETDLDLWRTVMAVNLDGTFLGTKAAVALMKERGGVIVNIASIRALAADPDSIAYDASKGAVVSLTRSAAVHCGRQGYPIRINALAPGYVLTDMFTEATAGLDDADALRAQVEAAHPIGRTGQPREIADAALFLASDASSFMIGSTLVVDGGFTAI